MSRTTIRRATARAHNLRLTLWHLRRLPALARRVATLEAKLGELEPVVDGVEAIARELYCGPGPAVPPARTAAGRRAAGEGR